MTRPVRQDLPPLSTDTSPPKADVLTSARDAISELPSSASLQCPLPSDGALESARRALSSAAGRGNGHCSGAELCSSKAEMLSGSRDATRARTRSGPRAPSGRVTYGRPRRLWAARFAVVGVAPGRRTRGVSESPRDGRSGRHTAPRGRDQGYASSATSLGGPCCACRPSTSSTRDVVGTARARFSATLRCGRRCPGSSGPSRRAQAVRRSVLRPKVVNCVK